MEEPVKRRYDGSRRQARTRATRAEVVAAARELFEQRGYPTTTIEAIADRSDVPVPTVYRLFGSKRGILSAVLDVAFGGDDEPVAFQERPAVRAAVATSDPGELLDAFARIARELLDRSAAIQHVVASAATVDAEAAELLTIARRQRHTGQSRIVRELVTRNALSGNLSEADAADIVYALMSPEMHRIITVERGWSPDRYERWLGSALRAQLLPSVRAGLTP